MLIPVLSSQFKRDVRRAKLRRKDMRKLRALLTLLIKQESVAVHYRDHSLRGNWKGYREVHIEPDWLLIYRVKGGELRLARTGTHSDLFKE